ncbi:MAG: phosphate ABC transporter substrate-binding protein, partial [Bacillota bacterium]
TADGKIVTEPVYTVATLLTDSGGNTAYLCFRADLARETETIQEPWGSYEKVSAPAILFATDGSWVKDYEDVRFCYGFTGVIDSPVNADYIAVKQGGKWGAVDMNGETVIPFDRDSPDGIYGQAKNGSETMWLRITANRYLSPEGLRDEKGQLLAAGVYGMPIAKAGDFFMIMDSEGEAGTFYSYTLDGKLLAKLEGGERFYGARLSGDHVLIYQEDRIEFYDRQLKKLSEIPLRFDEENNHYAYMEDGSGMLYDSDVNTKFHRTYLPDGTRLVTWYDPDMWEDLVQTGGY